MKIRIAVAALVALSACYADTLVLRSGKTVQGSFVGGTARQIRMAVEDRIETYSVSDIQSLQFDSNQAEAKPAQPPAPALDTQPAVSSSAAAVPPAAPAPPRDESRIMRPEPQAARTASSTAAVTPAAASANELATGTNITIRMIDDVDSQVATPGQTFRASVDDGVMVNGQPVIPRGADATLRLTELKEAGKISGGGQLTLVLDSVTANGRNYSLNTATVTQAGESRKKDSAKVIGGTAALGAIIGAIAGGGKGAAIGAASGAGAGTAIQVLTQGPRVRIPSETRLTFTLQQPVRL